ncbi:CerR family C-terminal domain-containing protein [Paraburkholderia sp. BCC1886]|uniref:CerR family C-terminal domain-containing protein n=1 Tax=Paraburkholderia sp. BCC1886 TaxID=2562670 RepID=UPI001181F1D1|nr:CerR family C-terminal domain-containing protein [Paraburkholderia sp. BCC1886]
MNTAKRPRHSTESGYARGEETRHRIIEAAADLFGEHGFDGASTRDIATRAGVNAPALQYYFENKEGVYRACIEAMVDEAWQRFGPPVTHAQRVLAGDADTATLIDAFMSIQEALADGAFAKVNKPNRRLFFAREQAGYEPESASQIINSRLRDPLNLASAALVGKISGQPGNDPVTVIRAFSLHGQLLVFHIAHRTTLTLLGWESMNAKNAELIKSTVRAQTRLLLERWAAERDALLAPAKKTRRVAPVKKS